MVKLEGILNEAVNLIETLPLTDLVFVYDFLSGSSIYNISNLKLFLFAIHHIIGYILKVGLPVSEKEKLIDSINKYSTNPNAPYHDELLPFLTLTKQLIS